MHRERMLGYYPNAIKSILEFNAIIDTESQEVDSLAINKETVLSDAYLPTMSERRIIQWENELGIKPSDNATLESRRGNVISRINGRGKLNTNLINSIVKSFTGNGCECWIDDSTLYVKLFPFGEYGASVDSVIANIANELSNKIPTHLGLQIRLIYNSWRDVDANNANWKTVNMAHKTWEDVLYNRRVALNKLDYSALDEFYLG